MFGVLGEP